MNDDTDIIVVDLGQDEDSKLKSLKKKIEEELEDRRKNRDSELAWKAIRTGEPSLIALAVAMMRQLHEVPVDEFQKLGVEYPCDPKKIGYYLAKQSVLERELPNEDHEKIRQEMIRKCDFITYVFATTHYDECSNGWFFRRS